MYLYPFSHKDFTFRVWGNGKQKKVSLKGKYVSSYVYHQDWWFWFINSLHNMMPKTGSSLQYVCHKLDLSGLLSCTLVMSLCLIGLGFANI